MTVFAALILAVLTFAFVAYPLLKRGAPSADSVDDDKLQELKSRRDTAYSMLKELEFDFHSGNLTEEDYQDLEAVYKRKAISILKDMDDLEKGSDVGEEIENRVLELRQGGGQSCPGCGARCQEADRFCSGCGASLSQGGQVD